MDDTVETDTAAALRHLARRLLAREAGGAIVVALPEARVLAVNGAGLAAIGLDPSLSVPSGMVLDLGLPAVARLAALAAQCTGEAAGEQAGRPPRAPEWLTFRTGRGARPLRCRVTLEPTPRGGTLALVAFVPVDAPPEPAHPDRAGAASRGGGPSPDDAATLREIARRIREGQLAIQRRTTVPAAVAPPSGREGATMAKGGGADTPSDAESGSGVAARPASPGVGAARPAPRLARLAHELKTPLSAIAAAAEIMRDERLGSIGDPRYRGYASDIYDSARHALLVIGNMLDGAAEAAAEPGADAAADAPPLPPMVFAELDLTLLVESCVSSMRPLADAARIVLAADLAPRLPHVIADATAVRQIVLNILTNALKFTPAGGSVRIATRHRAPGAVEIEVADTGRGMSDEEVAATRRATAGEPSAATAAAPRDGRGLGIGLPLVGALARANGAAVTIDSAPARGTRVVLAFAEDRVVPV